MATIPKDDSLTSKLKGRVGNLIFKQYADKTVVTSVPRISKKKKSIVQKFRNHHFRKAVRYAQSILCDPVRRKEMQASVPEGRRLYNYLIELYCASNSLVDEIDDSGSVNL